MTTIQLLALADGPELLEFELRNRAYFARSIPDRGDDYFERFDERQRALVAEIGAGTALLYVVRDETRRVVGRVNLADTDGGTADLGYRIGEDATGRGHASAAVRLVLAEARRAGLAGLRAMTTVGNVASRRVLEATGFERVEGEPTEVEHGGVVQETVHYQRLLR